MKFSLDVSTYKGVDGSSMTETRCQQTLMVYEMLQKEGGKVITYVGIQELAEKNKIFGSTEAKSARTTASFNICFMLYLQIYIRIFFL